MYRLRSRGEGMSRHSTLLAAIAALALGGLATPALADFSACDAGLRASDPHQKIDFYTICLTKGGLVATDRAGAYNNRGIAYLSLGEIDNALQDFSWAIENDPTWGTFHLNRGRIYLQRRDWAKADADFTAATRQVPIDARARAFAWRAQLRGRQGQYQAALADDDAAIKWDRKLVLAYNDKAWILATCPDAAIRDGRKAVELAQTALKLEDSPAGHDTLAAAYAEAGQFDDAAREQSKAIELLQAKSPNPAPADWQRRLDLYRSGMPFHMAAAPPPDQPAG